MANSFGTDILIQAEDPSEAAAFYVNEMGFEVTDESPQMISLHGDNINLFIEKGPALGPVLEVTVDSVERARARTVLFCSALTSFFLVYFPPLTMPEPVSRNWPDAVELAAPPLLLPPVPAPRWR